jgi:hypothetical protein
MRQSDQPFPTKNFRKSPCCKSLNVLVPVVSLEFLKLDSNNTIDERIYISKFVQNWVRQKNRRYALIIS